MTTPATTPMPPQDRAALLRQIWWAGVRAVDGGTAVARALAENPIPRPDLILAVGKAAVAMARPAHARFGAPTVAVTKHGHSEPDLPFEVIESAHPVPDAASLMAGERLLQSVQSAGPDSHLLLLVSGGASALAEALHPPATLDDLAALNRQLLASGQDIATMNATRTRLSRIKGGGLVAAFGGARVTVLAVSDTRGDLIETIGSGIGVAHPRAGLTIDSRIVASNSVARAAALAEARALGLHVRDGGEVLYDDVTRAADLVARDLPATSGLVLWGGEPTVILPPDPGRGGRNQALALHLARHIHGQGDISVLVGGTDGSDGPTMAAGGLVDGATWEEAATSHLAAADSGSFLDRRHALFTTGPTGTNVMDLALALRG